MKDRESFKETNMNELFNTLFQAMDDHMQNTDFYTASAVSPSVDISETKDAYTIEMDLPGKTESDINIELDRNVLTISSVKEVEKETSDTENKDSEESNEAAEKPEAPVTKWLLKERSTSRFARRFTLPEDIDSENIAASFKNGVLNVIVPRKALAAPKKIAITA